MHCCIYGLLKGDRMGPWIHKNPNPERCYQEVGDYSLNWPRYHQCYRKWKVEVDGNRWCKQHSPEVVATRQEASSAKATKEWDSRMFKIYAGSACGGVPKEMLKPGIVRKLINYVYEMDNEALIKELEGG